MNDGWIKLYRKIQTSEMYRNLTSKQRDVMIQCLILANHNQKSWEWGAEIFECKPGQFITSLENLREKCAKDVKVQSVRTALLKLEKWHFLTNESTKTGRLITICKWDIYQTESNGANKDANRQPTKSQQRANKELTTNKKDKKEKNEKNIPPKIEDVKSYCIERGNNVDPNRWYDFYCSKGWMVGKNKMRDWKAAVRTWEEKKGGKTIISNI